MGLSKSLTFMTTEISIFLWRHNHAYIDILGHTAQLDHGGINTHALRNINAKCVVSCLIPTTVACELFL